MEECQYLIDTLLLLDILNSELTDEVKNLFTDIQQDLAYYDSDSADYNYFGNEVFLEKLKIFYNLLNDNF